MKILKEGNPKKAVISCHECGCEMEYTNADMHTHIETNYNTLTYPLRSTKTYYLICPCCKEEIAVGKL